MIFHYVEEHIQTGALRLSFHLAPWDRPYFPGNTAVVTSVQLGEDDSAGRTSSFALFRDWCRDNEVRLVCCRLPHDRLAECGFLEGQGFRFIELHYLPVRDRLEQCFADPEIEFVPATSRDVDEIQAFARHTFTTGRIHADPQIDNEIGNRRYAGWIGTALDNPGQEVVKGLIGGRATAYQVFNRTHDTTAHWSLFCLAPGLTGQGLGRRFYQTTLAWKHRQGFHTVAAPVSSLNVPSINLLRGCGFRFPAPAITLHWCPFGPIAAPE